MTEDIVFPVVECPHGPHDVLPLYLERYVDFGSGNQKLTLLMCPDHNNMLNLTTRVAIKEWLSEAELLERGYKRL